MTILRHKLMTLVAALVAISASAEDTTRKLVCSYNYGDALGTTSIDVCTGKRYYFYDGSGNPQAVINSKTEQGASQFVTVDYNSYSYNSLGQLDAINAFQYGAFDFLQRDIKPSPALSSVYEYDAQGNLVSVNRGGEITEYEYDAEGNIIKETLSTGKTVVYEDFTAGKNKYAKAVSTHTNKNSEAEFYDEYVTYDAHGNKTSALRMYNTDTSYTLFGKVYGHQVGDFMSYEMWSYDENDIVLLYQKSIQQDEVSGDYLWNSKTEYERIDGNPDMIRRVNYDARYDDDVASWSRRSTPFVDEYRHFTDAEMLGNLTLSAATSETNVATVVLTISIPSEVISAGVSKVNIYRNGELVKEVSEVSETMTIEDKGVRNGEQEYFYTLTMPGKDYAEYCSSNKAVAVVNTTLPKAVNLTVENKAQGSNGTFILTFGFNYNGDVENTDFGYKESFLIINGGGYPDDNSTARTNNPRQLNLKRDIESGREVTVQVATRYALGTVLSTPIVLNASTVQVGDPTVMLLEQGVPATGPGAGKTAYYRFDVPCAGILSIANTFEGSVLGTYTVNGGEAILLRNSTAVDVDDQVLITVTCQEDNTNNTITVTVSDFQEGSTPERAITLAEGDNDIAMLKNGEPAVWYKYDVPAEKRGVLTFTGYPVFMAYEGAAQETMLGTANPVDYINTSADAKTIYIRLTSTNDQPLTATLQYKEPVADLTQFGALAYSIEKNGDVENNGSITVIFPERVGGTDDETVELSYWIFSIKGGNPDGAPINLGGVTSAQGTLGAGVEVNVGDQLTVGKKYRLTVQSLRCGNHYAPGPDEMTITSDHIDFYCTDATGIVKVYNDADTDKAVYNLAGQRLNSAAKGIIIINGKKITK